MSNLNPCSHPRVTHSVLSILVAAVIGVTSSGQVPSAQNPSGSAVTCEPGVRPGGAAPGTGRIGALHNDSAFEWRFCGGTFRIEYAMGGAPFVISWPFNTDYFPPTVVSNASAWHQRDYLYGEKLCEKLPSASDLPGAKVTARLIHAGSTAGTSATVTLRPDTDKPTLNTTSTPRKGSRVKPGDTIKIRMEASEEYTQQRIGWQTGVKKLQLIDEGPNPVVTPQWEGDQMRACAAKQWKQFLEVTYRVPPNPPPVIRLRAVAEDFAGNQDFDVAEFPTGEWFGTIKKTAKGGGHNHTIDIAFAFGIETNGQIKGRAHARIITEEGQVPGCTMLWTYSPSEFEFPLSGRRNGENFEITLEPPGTTRATLRDNCSGSLRSTTYPSQLNPVHGRTTFVISAQDGATNTVEQIAGALPWGVAMRDTIQIHQARDNRVSWRGGRRSRSQQIPSPTGPTIRDG